MDQQQGFTLHRFEPKEPKVRLCALHTESILGDPCGRDRRQGQ